MLARYTTWPCVRLSVRLLYAGVLSKRLNLSGKQRRTVLKGLEVSAAKDFGDESSMESLPEGLQINVHGRKIS